MISIVTKKRQTKNTQTKIEELIEKARKTNAPINSKEMKALIRKGIKEKSTLAFNLYDWITGDPEPLDLENYKPSTQFLKDSVAVSAVVEAYIETLSRMASAAGEGITPALKRQISMSIAALILKHEYQDMARIAFLMVQSAPVLAFQESVSEMSKSEEMKRVLDNLRKQTEVTKDSKDKTYI